MLPGAVHEIHGVRWSEASPQRLPRNYGDPAGEYAAARTAVVVADRADRRILRVYGRDPVRMLQGLITNDIAAAPPTRAVYGAVLTPKGRMVADVRVLRHGADLLIDVDAAAADALVGHLRKYVPPLFAKFEDASDAWSELGLYGSQAAGALERVLGVRVAESREDDVVAATFAEAPLFVVATSQFGVPGCDMIAPPATLEALWTRLVDAGARPIGHATLDVLRIEAGRPRWGAELDDTTIPLEAGLRERAISETKGCYTGQEVIIRILHRGHVNWLLRGVLLGDVPAPPHGTPLLQPADAKKVGRITSAAWSPTHAQTIALAYVRREIAPPAELRLDDGSTVTVVALPFPGDSHGAE